MGTAFTNWPRGNDCLTVLQILEAIGVDYIDESEVLTPADETHHVDKHPFKAPFVCGCRNLGEALRRISEGAAMSTFFHTTQI